MFFHALTFARSPVSCLKSRLLGREFSRDPANVNAIKQTYMIVILCLENTVKLLIILFCTLNHSVENGVSLWNRTSNVISAKDIDTKKT